MRISQESQPEQPEFTPDEEAVLTERFVPTPEARLLIAERLQAPLRLGRMMTRTADAVDMQMAEEMARDLADPGLPSDLQSALVFYDAIAARYPDGFSLKTALLDPVAFRGALQSLFVDQVSESACQAALTQLVPVLLRILTDQYLRRERPELFASDDIDALYYERIAVSTFIQGHLSLKLLG